MMKAVRFGWFVIAAASLSGCGGNGSKVAQDNRYEVTNLVANNAKYSPQIVEPGLQDAWGISLRPAGAGGHFWVTANVTGKSFEYIGDVGGVPLKTDALKEVSVPDPGGVSGTPSGTVFNGGNHFVITQDHPKGPITAPAKFFFATTGGAVTAWTERPNGDGSVDRPTDSVIVFDGSARGDQYFGMAINATNDRLYLADFGAHPKVVVLDASFHEITGGFVNPYPGLAPWGIQAVGSSIFVAYAKVEQVGEEEHGVGLGHIAEFDSNGNLVAKYDDRSLLNAPWSFTIAPPGFGKYAGKLLVSNFGNGTITVFDRAAKRAIDYLRNPDGSLLIVDGIWQIIPGNGVLLGRSDALYFAAGPNGEADGVFGRITAVP